MNKPIKVLLLDDNAEKIKTELDLNAKSNRVIIFKALSNSTEGIEYIRKNHSRIDAIILDGYFWEKPTSSSKKDITALRKTIRELQRLLDAENISLPYCVLTGYAEELITDSLFSDVKIFRKGRVSSEMYDYLKGEVAKKEDYQIKNEFQEIFELFDKSLMPEDKEEDLVEILRKMKSKAKYNDDDAFNPIRKMYEAFINELHDQTLKRNNNQDIVHERLYDHNGNLSILWSWLYLSGKEVRKDNTIEIAARSEPVWPEHISYIVKSMIDTFQTTSHDYADDINHYAYKSIVFALLELLLWYKEFIQEYS